jgi:hypothetical protein
LAHRPGSGPEGYHPATRCSRPQGLRHLTGIESRRENTHLSVRPGPAAFRSGSG